MPSPTKQPATHAPRPAKRRRRDRQEIPTHATSPRRAAHGREQRACADHDARWRPGCRSSCGAASIWGPRGTAGRARSAAALAVLHQLWRRMLLSSATPPAGAPKDDHFVALRLEALIARGCWATWTRGHSRPSAPGPADQACGEEGIGLGRREGAARRSRPWPRRAPGCPAASRVRRKCRGLLRCRRRRAQAAGLAAEPCARGRHRGRAAAGGAGGLATGSKPKLRLPKRVLLLDYRFLELLGPVDATQVLDKAEPALLAVLAADAQTDARLTSPPPRRRCGSMPCRPRPGPDLPRQLSRGQPADPPPSERSAAAARAAISRRSSFARAGAAGALGLRASARRCAALGHAHADRAHAGAAAWTCGRRRSWRVSAETAVEIALAAGEFEPGPAVGRDIAALQHWLALIDIADPERAAAALAVPGGRRGPGGTGPASVETLHRLATVLDALDIDVPVPLWDAASRTPQPAGGYLPETGVLADLASPPSASEVRRAPSCWSCARWGRTARRAPTSWRSATPSAALKRIGLEADARRLASRRCCRCWPRADPPTDDAAMTSGAPATSRLPGDDRRRARRGRQHAARPIARDLDDFLAFLERRGRSLRRPSRPTSPPTSRAVGGRLGAGLARAPAVGRASAVQVSGRPRAWIADDPALGFAGPKKSPRPAQDAVGGRGRPPDRGGAAPHRDQQGPRRVRALRLHALIEMLYATGMRVTELVTLPRRCSRATAAF